MKCPYCSNEIKNGSKECEICGVSLENSVYRNLGIPTGKTIDKFGGVIFLLSSLVAIAFGIAWTWITLSFVSYDLFPLYGFTVVGIGVILYGICYLLTSIDMITGNNKFESTLEKLTPLLPKIMLLGFFTFWFGILIIADYQILTNLDSNGGMPTFFFTLIFWVAGIIGLVAGLRKK